MNNAQKSVEKHKLEQEARQLKVLKAVYTKAVEDICNKLVVTNGKIEVFLKDLDNLDVETKSLLQSQIYHKNFQENTLKQINSALKTLSEKQYTSISEYLKECYKTGFTGAVFELTEQGIPLIIPIDAKKVAKAINLESKINVSLYKKLGEDTEVLKKRIANNIARGIAAADSYEHIARNIKKDSKVGLNKAMRIARTEGHRVHIESSYDAMLEAENHGANIVKQWNSQLDGNTRYTHRLLDAQIRELHEPFEVLGTKVMYPSAFGIASEDINCRCVIHQRARWALGERELETLRHRAKKHGLQTGDKEYFEQVKAKDFEDFKNKYLIAAKKMAETLANTGESSKIVPRIFNTIEDPMREVTGAGLKSNPKEVQLMLDNLTAAGAEVEYRTEAMGYMPNVVAGKAGKLVIDREASYSAWLHEYTHFEDDKKEGFIGLRIFMDIEKCKQWEIHAYDVEKELAREANRPDIVERLEKLKRKEVAKYETSDND